MNTPQVVFLVGKNVILRPLNEETDLEICHRWINSPEIRPLIGSGTIPLTRETEKEFFKKANQSTKVPKNIVLGIVLKETKKLIGNIGLHDISWIDRSATTGTMIGAPENRGKGYGSEAKEMLLEYAFMTLNLNRIGSKALNYNRASRRYSEKCGYREEGRARQAIYKDGQYHDLVYLSILRSDWEKHRRKTTRKTKKRS